MKKLMSFVLVIALALSMVACAAPAAEETAPTAEATAPTEEAAAPAEETAAPADATALIGRYAGSTDFDPDTCTDFITGDNFVTNFGELAGLNVNWKDLKCAVVVKTLANESWTNIAGGIKTFLEENGVGTVDLVAPDSESDAEQQQSLVDALLIKDYDIIFMSPQADTTLDAQCKEAHEAGIIVVNAFDSTMQEADVYAGNISLDTGRLAAKYICETWCGGEGKVAVVEGLAGAYASINRTAGYLEKCAEYEGIEVFADVVGNWDRQTAMDQATTIINQYPDLKAIYCCNDTMALGVIEAVKEAGKLGEICVIGSDGVEAAMDSINAGELTGTIDLNLYAGGRMAAEAGMRLFAGQELPRVIQIPQLVITKDNTNEHVGYTAE